MPSGARRRRLKKLPELTPEIDVQIEVAHRMGGENFSENYSYTIKLNQGAH